MRFAATRETPDWANPGSLLEEGGDFGFGWGSGGGLLGALPHMARGVVGSILKRRATVVISPTVPTIPRPAPPPPEEGEVVAHDWGHLAREFLGGVVGQAIGSPVGMAPPAFAQGARMALVNGCGLDGQVWGGQAPPKGYKVVNYCGQAVLRKIKRRRRKRLLTASDSQDIATIVGLVGKGQMASALINRTRG